MEQIHTFAKHIVESLGFKDFRIEIDPETQRGVVFIYDNPALVKENLPAIVESVNHLTRLISKKHNLPPVFIDVNNYRKERENLIVELARAAAKKVAVTKEDIPLPAMNAYERRIVHSTLAVHPEVTTESIGEAKKRYVVVKLIREESKS